MAVNFVRDPAATSTDSLVGEFHPETCLNCSCAGVAELNGRADGLLAEKSTSESVENFHAPPLANAAGGVMVTSTIPGLAKIPWPAVSVITPPPALFVPLVTVAWALVMRFTTLLSMARTADA